MDSKSMSSWVGSFTENTKLEWLALERLDKFTSEEYWTDLNLNKKRFYSSTSTTSLKLQHFAVPDLKRPLFKEVVPVLLDEFKDLTPPFTGKAFGPSWSTHYFKLVVTVPSDWIDKEVHLVWDSDCEALIYTNDGQPLQGFTGGNGCDRRASFVLSSHRTADWTKPVVFYMEMACNGMFGNAENGFLNPPSIDRKFTLKTCHLALFDRAVYALYLDFITVRDIAVHRKGSRHGRQALRVATAALNVLDMNDPSTYVKTTHILRQYLKQTCASNAPLVTAVGGCHIDTAWLWPYAETRRKCARSWASQLELCERHPGYKFVLSQAVQCAWVKEDYPLLWDRIVAAVKKGQFVAEGGVWVEMDCNIPSGESMVRQFLYGQEFFRCEFGVRSSVGWLPDTFGYCSQLPQICRGVGMEYFLTQKLSWSLVTTFPHHTFTWHGLDGSDVLVHFPPEDTYNGQARVQDVLTIEKNHKSDAINPDCIMLFGNGDGGGGPLDDMLERLTRMQDFAPLDMKVELNTPRPLFDRLLKNKDEYPVWSGLLYLEGHRGTYTSQAILKLKNRKCEILMHTFEFLCTYLARVSPTYKYPRTMFEKMWKSILLNQFHDVLPGSCIRQVVTDALTKYEQVQTLADEIQQVIEAEFTHFFPPNSLVLVNSHSWTRHELVPMSSQTGVFARVTVPPCSVVPVSLATLQPLIVAPSDRVSGTFDSKMKLWVLENGLVRASFNTKGVLVELWDKRVHRQVLSENGGNRFLLFEDIPFFWDAWDVEIHHLQKPCDLMLESRVSIKLAEPISPARAVIELKLQLSSKSSLVQYIMLSAYSPRIEFHCEIQWHEAHSMLKVEFPFNVKADTAAYEVQFGYEMRPTHWNTPADIAKFEVCGHRWADLSECDYGVALLNDCKYGYSCLGSTMRLSLLRSPKKPDEHADMGTHIFRYALLPHVGSLQMGRVTQEAAEFNEPIFQTRTHAEHKMTCDANKSQCMWDLNVDHVFISAVKTAETEDNSVIVRLYEGYGARSSRVRLFMSSSLGHPAKISMCNLLEEEEGEQLTWSSDTTEDGVWSACFSMKPFQIRTLKISY